MADEQNTVPAHEAMAAMLSGQSEPRKVGLFGRIMGQKHQQNLREDENNAKFVLEQLMNVSTGKSQLPPETVDMLTGQLGKILGKDTGAAFKQHFEQMRAKQEVDARMRMLPGHENDAPTSQPGQSAFNPGPTAAAQPEQQLTDDHKKQLIQMVMAQAQGQQQGGNPFQPAASPAATQGLQASPPPGIPPPPVPFANGAGPAGPAPAPQPNPAAETATSSAKGTIGFGGPSATPPPSRGTMWGKSPVQQGVDTAASEMAQSDVVRQHYGNDPRVKGLSDAQSLEFETGRRIPMMPTFQTAGIAMSKQGDLDRNNAPVEEGTPGKYVTYQGKTFFEPEPGSLRFEKVLNPDGTTSVRTVSRFTGKVGEANPALQSAPRVRMVRVDMGDGTTHHVGVTATGKFDSDDPRLVGINAAVLPTDKNVFKLITNPDGSTVLQPVTESSGKVLPGSLPAAPRTPTAAAPGLPAQPVPPGQAAAPPGPGPVIVPPVAPPVARGSRGARIAGAPIAAGGRPMTPEQQIKSAQVAEQLNNTIGTIKDIRDKVPMLASMFTSGKIALQVDPHQGFWKAIINKNMPLTPEEADLASDWQLLTEGVMQMRIPMGGAGFRGPEGFGAIQSNKGILGQHPEIIQRVLDGTLREFKAQRQPLVDASTKYGYKVDPEYGPGFRKAQAGITPPPEKRYTWTSNGQPMHGAIPSDRLAEFLRLHPEAKEQ
jgi:hypothetical protein